MVERENLTENLEEKRRKTETLKKNASCSLKERFPFCYNKEKTRSCDTN